jgi:molybdopterin converting factor small subunit
MGKVSVRFFARYAELAGCDSQDVVVRRGATVRDVLAHVRESIPGLPERPLAAVNLRQVKLDAPVSDGDEVALLPPLSGG